MGGIIFLAAAALLAGMLVGKFHKKDARNQNATKENTNPTKSVPEAPKMIPAHITTKCST